MIRQSITLMIGRLSTLLVYLCLLAFNFANGQIPNSVSNYSASELQQYVLEAQQKGYSEVQLRQLAKQYGATDSQIDSILRRNNFSANTLKQPSNKGQRIENSFGYDQKSKNISTGASEIFGADFFNNPNVSLIPQLNLATPDTYQLGPGDEILIALWGSSTQSYQKVISRDGQISIQGIAPIFISGLTVKEAKNKIKRNLRKIYIRLYSSTDSERIYLDVSLVKARSIVINIIGQVKTPGTYTLNGFSSPLNALYACGGITELGSYRAIEVIRNGKTFATIDLYQYLTKGIAPELLLRDQDVLLVPYYGKRVEVIGAVKKNGLFETLEDETLQDVLKYSGGFLSEAVKEQITVDRIEGSKRKLSQVSKDGFSETVLQNGDIITALALNSEYENKVTIQGAVVAEGVYQLEESPTVFDLIQNAGGLSDGALKAAGILYRTKDGIEEEIISIDLKLLSKRINSIPLESNDRLVIFDKKEINPEDQVMIHGEVQNPGIYTFYEGMTLRDLILTAEGFLNSAHFNEIRIYSAVETNRGEYDYSLTNTIAIERDFSLSLEKNIPLSSNDVVIVSKNPAYKTAEYVIAEGEFKKPGRYLIQNSNYSVSELIKEAGGLSSKASLNGIYVLRSKAFENQKILVDTLEIALDETVKIPIEFNAQNRSILFEKNIPLVSGDRLIAKPTDNTVKVNGAVLKESVISYDSQKSTRQFIKEAGGFGNKALRRSVYVINPNGSVRSTKSFMGIKSYPRVSPGAVVFVPEKEEKVKRSTQEIIGITSSLVAMAALIRTLSN